MTFSITHRWPHRHCRLVRAAAAASLPVPRIIGRFRVAGRRPRRSLIRDIYALIHNAAYDPFRDDVAGSRTLSA